MATKTKKKTFTNVTLDEAQEASQTYAVNSTKLQKIEAKMNEEINSVKSKYQDQITELKEECEEPLAMLEAFAFEQKSSWGKKKSFELLHCVVSFRTGTPKVDKSKKFTWDGVVELMKKNKLFKNFIRTKEEINKDAILAEKNEELLDRLKEECSVEVVQDETFSVDVKKEEV